MKMNGVPGFIVQEKDSLLIYGQMCLQLLEVCELCIGKEACRFLLVSVWVGVCKETPETLRLMEVEPPYALVVPHAWGYR